MKVIVEPQWMEVQAGRGGVGGGEEMTGGGAGMSRIVGH